jgi:hypothetical protein
MAGRTVKSMLPPEWLDREALRTTREEDRVAHQTEPK